MTVRRYVVGALVGLSVVASYDTAAAAQVGQDPARSPFRDIILHPGLGTYVGYLTADRGRVGAGFSNAVTIGARYEIPMGRALALQFGTTYLSGDRFIIDPRADSASPQRRTGPYPSNLLLVSTDLHLRLTGAKTWRGIAPFVGLGLGMLFDVHSPGDTTTGIGYKFGTKLTLSAATGARLYPSRRLVITAEARAQLWRLKYPVSFHTQLSPDGSRVVPITEPLNDWTLHPWLSLGIGWTF